MLVAGLAVGHFVGVHRTTHAFRAVVPTAREAVRVEKREGKIAVHEAQAKADGVVTPGERRRLRREKNRASNEQHDQRSDQNLDGELPANRGQWTRVFHSM